MKRWLTIFTIAALAMVAYLSFVMAPTPVNAGDSDMVTGTGFVPVGNECDVSNAPPSPNDTLAVLNMNVTGDLDGCLYSYVLWSTGELRGSYREIGIDIFVGDLYHEGELVGSGTFETFYLFEGEFADDNTQTELWGGCVHPLVPNRGTGVFQDAGGTLRFTDNVSVSPPTFPYKLDLKWMKSNKHHKHHGDD